jgi:hypothetical protein
MAMPASPTSTKSGASPGFVTRVTPVTPFSYRAVQAQGFESYGWTARTLTQNGVQRPRSYIV